MITMKNDGQIAPGVMRRLTWINIFIQFSLPLVTTFTSAIASESKKPELKFYQTQTYTLGYNESVVSVAKKYNIPLEELRKLNQFRVFAHGFDHLQPGDELDVPIADVGQGNISGKGNMETEGVQAQKIVGYASQAGSFLSNHPNSSAASAMAKGIATGAVNADVQKWFNQFGSARVQFNVDNDLSLKNSQLDLLLPLSEQKNNILFSQGSFHRTDDRNQANLGVGYRRFANDWMLGGNAFLDYDISREHTRLGMGVEYWRDFLKLGINSYQRLTGWRDSSDLTDYEERPANGWDIRAQGWLPNHPQLGGKLVYEQYYGKEVGLFGKDNRQHNPHAITTEINYTPVPLLTFSAAQRQGKSGNNDTRLGIDAKYQFGVPWIQQIDPDAVMGMRTLTGNRYDLVDRNNNIILEYRKKETIHLKTASLVTGQPGETKSLGVMITSKYSVERVEWTDGGLVAAGGEIIQNGREQSVVLPPWRSGSAANNTYMMGAVAVDKKGNTSNRSETQITVQEPAVSTTNSTFMPANSTLTAGSESSQVLTLTIKDDQGNAVSVDPDNIKLDTGRLKSASVSPPVPVMGQNGVFRVTVAAGIDRETVTVTPVVANMKLSPATIVITSGEAVPQHSSISIDKSAYTSGDDMKVMVMLQDAAGNPVIGQSSELTDATVNVPDARLKTGSTWKDNGNGTYTAIYVAEQAGTGLIASIHLPDWTTKKDATLTYTIVASTVADERFSSINVDKVKYVAGSDMMVTVKLQDAAGNPVNGQESTLTDNTVTVEHAVPKSNSIWTDNNNGTYTRTYKTNLAGMDLKAAVKLTNWTVKKDTTYDITASMIPDENTSGITTDKSMYSSGSNMVVKINLRDAGGNPIGGKASELTSGIITVPHATAQGGWTDNNDGSYTAGYIAGQKGSGLKASVKLASWVNPKEMDTTYDIVTTNIPDENKSSITVDKASYISGDDITVTVILKDNEGNPVSGQVSALTAGAVTVPHATLKPGSIWTESSDGTYTATYIAGLAGTNLMASVQLASWMSQKDATQAYDISSSNVADEELSGIKVDKTNYTAGDNIIVTVTLLDAWSNPVTGYSDSLSASTVTVPNAIMGSSQWREDSEGIYTATYIAQSSGTSLQAYMKLTEWTKEKDAAGVYNIYASTTPDASEGNSTFVATPKSIVANNSATSTLTFTAKDVGGNLIIGLSDVSFGVTAAGGDSSRVSVGPVSESNGVYTATLKGTLADEYTVVPIVNGSPVSGLSDTVTLTVAVQSIQVNGYTFAVDAGFPKTGFLGAKFTVTLNGGKPTDYDWDATASWVHVDNNGVVTFSGQGSSSLVTITATSRADRRKTLSYVFSLTDWWIPGESQNLNWSDANTWCINQGMSLGTRLQLGGTAMSYPENNTRGTVGSLWSEWGDLHSYPDSGFPGDNDIAWTSEVNSPAYYYNISLKSGLVNYNLSSFQAHAVCRKGGSF